MIQILRKKHFITSVLLGVSAIGFAQQKQNVITTAVPFLRISADARSGGMGETGVAISPDVNAQFYNIAKYPFAAAKSGIGMTYTPWLKKLGLNDVYLVSLAGYYKIDDNQAVSASLKYFSLGNLQITDYDGNDMYTEHPREMSIDAGYSRKLSNRLSLGIALRYIHSNLAGNTSSDGITYKAGNAVSADLGLYYTTVKENQGGWSAGIALSNLGTKMSYSSDVTQKNYLPANLGIGIGYSWVIDSVHKLSLTGEINKLLVPAPPDDASEDSYKKYNEDGVVNSWVNSFGNKAMAYSAGGEYIYNNQFAVRAGYYTDSRTMGKRNYFTAGLGVNYQYALEINFSYLIPSGKGANLNPLSNTMRFSLIITPGSGK